MSEPSPTKSQLEAILTGIEMDEELLIFSSGESEVGDNYEYMVDINDLEELFSQSEEEWLEPSNKYNWNYTPEWKPKVNNFNEFGYSGCTDATIGAGASPLDIFEVFLTGDLVENIVTETNQYYKYLVETDDNSLRPYNKGYKPITSEEMLRFIGVTLLMSKIKKIKFNDYWTSNPLLVTPIFNHVTNRDRHYTITEALHFSDNHGFSTDQLCKIKLISDSLRNSFKNSFSPYEDIFIEETQLLTKGGLLFEHNMSRRSNFDLKLHTISDSKTGYVLDFCIETGKLPPAEVVLKLVEDYRYRGHKLYLAPRYSDPDLFLSLFNVKINACGVVSKNRRNMPRIPAVLKTGEMSFLTSGPLLAMKWSAKQETYVLSSIHEMQVEEGRPVALLDLRKKSKVNHKARAALSSVKTLKKTVKWYKKIFFQLLDLSLINAHALYNEVASRNVSLLDFHFQLIRDIFAKYSLDKPKSTMGKRHHDYPLRLSGRHFPSKIAYPKVGNPSLRRCVVCNRNKKRQRTQYFCKECDAPLCVVPCFEIYHTRESLIVRDVVVKVEAV